MCESFYIFILRLQGHAQVRSLLADIGRYNRLLTFSGILYRVNTANSRWKAILTKLTTVQSLGDHRCLAEPPFPVEIQGLLERAARLDRG